ncbi:MAG: hypothetical protein WEC75_13335 [Dehalococcoidia bacterium]
MFRKIAIIGVVLAVAATAFGALAPAASAQETEEERRGRVLLHGRGVLDAQGDGVAAVKGRMDYDVSADAGALLVQDHNGNADIEVTGYEGTVEWRGFTIYYGFEGEAHIIGGDVSVVVVGRNIDLHVAGKGWAFLKGQGTFEVNGRGPFRWTEAGAFAWFEETADE